MAELYVTDEEEEDGSMRLVDASDKCCACGGGYRQASSALEGDELDGQDQEEKEEKEEEHQDGAVAATRPTSPPRPPTNPSPPALYQ